MIDSEAFAASKKQFGNGGDATDTLAVTRFTITGAGVLHVRASDLVQTDAFKRQVGAIPKIMKAQKRQK